MRSKVDGPAALVSELRSFAGLAATLGFGVTWALLSARTPTNTFHFAPLIMAAAWCAVDGSIGAGLTPRRVLNQALGGFLLAGAVTLILDRKGDLRGPSFWREADTANVAVEHIIFAAAGSLIGAVVAIRHARGNVDDKTFLR